MSLAGCVQRTVEFEEFPNDVAGRYSVATGRRVRYLIDEAHLLAIAAIDPNDHPTARNVFDDLRSETYITNRGDRGIELDNSAFAQLAGVLHDECGWEPFEIESRLKHYEGWDDHECA